MSEGQAQDKTFADAKGTEANQHAKKLAKEKSTKAKHATPRRDCETCLLLLSIASIQIAEPPTRHQKVLQHQCEDEAQRILAR